MTTESSGNSRPMTRGEYRVGITFNPSSNALVDEVKRRSADLIDTLLSFADTAVDNPEAVFQANEAARKIEDAAMNGVKAVTKGRAP
jgi:hypothetical protein